GFKDFRTFVLTKDGKNAVEYTTEVMNVSDEVKQYSYKMTGTLTYDANSSTIQFHAQSGKMRIFSNKYEGYKEHDIVQEDVDAYSTILTQAEATTYSSSTNYLTAKRIDGGLELSVKYVKMGDAPSPGGGSSSDYSKPPTTGTFVQIGNQYYPTVTTGDLEWMSVNYAGLGGITDSSKPHY